MAQEEPDFSNLYADLCSIETGDNIDAPGSWIDPQTITPTFTAEPGVQNTLVRAALTSPLVSTLISGHEQQFCDDVDMFVDHFDLGHAMGWPDASEGALNPTEQSPPGPPPVAMLASMPAQPFEHIRSPPRRSSTLNPEAPVYTPLSSPQRQSTFGFDAAFRNQMQTFPVPFEGFQSCSPGPVCYPTPLQLPRQPLQPHAPARPFMASHPYRPLPPSYPVLAAPRQPPVLHMPSPPPTAPQDRGFLSPITTSGPLFAWKNEQPHDSAHPSHNTLSPISAVSTPVKPGRRSRGHSVVSNTTRNSCVSCGKGFQTGADLRHHERNHKSDEEKAFCCEACDVRFIWKKDLTRHEASKRHRKRLAQAHAQASLEVYLNCTHKGCEKVRENGFARQDHLERHLATVHKG